jgi:glutathione S-transferase
LGRRSGTGREKRVTPEFGERKKKKFYPQIQGVMADDLKVLGLWTSPFVIRVRIMLNLKGLAYEYAEEDLGNKSALLLSSNPVHKTVLVLLHAGRPVNKSQIILQYIDKVWAGTRPTVLRCDPYKHAVTRFWVAG